VAAVILVAAWKRVVLERYALFSGRAGRAEFWWFFLANLIVGAILSILGRAATIFVILYALYGLALIIPSLAVSIRRLHDIGRSGWWILIGLIPIVGVIVLLIFHATAGEAQPNAYGPTPPPLAA
jgi:uncharacterized membrane protein YhaH (DUF805 family)